MSTSASFALGSCLAVGEDEGVASWMLLSVLAGDGECLFKTGVLFTEFWSPSCRPDAVANKLGTVAGCPFSETIVAKTIELFPTLSELHGTDGWGSSAVSVSSTGVPDSGCSSKCVNEVFVDLDRCGRGDVSGTRWERLGREPLPGLRGVMC